jgi:hypothetical protein
MNKIESARLASPLGLAKIRKIRLERIARYNLDPIKCKQCKYPLSYEDKIAGKIFCGRSCSASYNNLGVCHNSKKRIPKKCTACENLTLSKFCSVNCSARHRKNLIYALIESGKYTADNKKTIRNYLIEKRGYQCEKCGRSKWLLAGVPIPLESHHKDGNHQNNHPSNLELLCLNCHGITPNYRSKNKGNGRFSRMQRYRMGKSF